MGSAFQDDEDDVELSAPKPIIAEEQVAPAVGKTVQGDAVTAQENQRQARSRMRGIRSTYSALSSTPRAANGASATLG